MAISRLQGKSANSGGSYLNAFSITPDSPVSAGSLLVLTLITSQPNTTDVTSVGDTSTNGWSRGPNAQKTTDGQAFVEIWYAPNAAAGTPTITANNANYVVWSATLQEFAGIATTAPLDVTATYVDSGYVQTHYGGTTAATTQADELSVAGFATSTEAPGWTVGVNYTGLLQATNTGAYLSGASQYRVLTATGIQQSEITTSSYIIAAGVIATFKAGEAVVLPDPPATAIGRLKDVYAGWKQYFLQSSGRIRREDGTTVSEGQGYHLQFAAMFNDQTTFDLAETYNRNVLERRLAPNGALTNPGGLYLMAGQSNASGVTNWDWASDGDIDRLQGLDMAQAFVDQGIWTDTGMAYGARRDLIVADLVAVGSKLYGTDTTKRYMLPESYQLSRNPFVMNASYFDFATLRELGTPEMYQLLQGSYDQITRVQNGTNGLIPNWHGADTTADTVSHPFTNLDGFTYSDDYAYEAFRAIFRLARDYSLNGSKQALALLQPFATFMNAQWQTYGSIDAEYTYSGSRKGGYEKSSMTFAAYIALVLTGNTTTAQAIYDAKLKNLYVQNASGSYYADAPTGSTRDYYTLSWIMFGMLFHLGLWQKTMKKVTYTRTTKSAAQQGAIARVRKSGSTDVAEVRVFKNGRWTN